jgi:predicted phage terminase large subunit-like protein
MDLTQLSREQIDAVLCANNFRRFVERFWHLVSSDPFVPGYHLDAICDHLQAVAEGRVKRLAVNVAIRHSKSLLCSVMFPVWLWTRDPSTRIITASYSKDLTVRDAIRSRAMIEHDEFKKHFGHFALQEDVNRRDFYSNDKGGHRLSVSIGSRTSGFDADIVVADDLHDFATRTSDAERASAIDYFETALCSRLVYTGREAVVIAGHRVHEDDVYAMLRAKYGDDGTWSWLVLPEEYNDKFAGWFNATGWVDTRADGELLWPEKFDRSVIDQQRKAYRHEYSAIFLQEPTPAEGSLFKPEWFRTWTTDEHGNYVLDGKSYPQSSAWRFITVDTAISTTSGADYTVAQVWDIVGPNLVLVDQLRKRLDGNRIVPALVELWRVHAPQFVCVESEFVGRFVLDQLRAADVTVKPFRARGQGTKETRAVAAEIRCEAGRVFFPSDKPWVADLQRELLGFPNAAHDDQVDALAMACILADKYSGPVEPAISPRNRPDANRPNRIGGSES